MVKQKGAAYIWLTVLVALGIIAVAYIAMNQVIYSDYGLYNIVNSSINSTYPQKTLDTLNVVWNYWPLIAVFGVIIWGFVRSQRREYEEYY